jgi:hypothetical protein
MKIPFFFNLNEQTESCFSQSATLHDIASLSCKGKPYTMPCVVATKRYQIQKGAFQLHLLSAAELAYPAMHPYLNYTFIQILTPFYVVSAWRRHGSEITPVLPFPLMIRHQNYH